MIIQFPWKTIAIALGGLLSLAAGVVLWLLLRRRTEVQDDATPLKQIDFETLDEEGPNGLSPQLTLYHQPVRLALIAIAPVGRDQSLPPVEEMPEVVDALVPGMMQVLNAHRPTYQPWPSQLSVSGFHRLFAKYVTLPGHHGKGTCWASVTGPFEYEQHRYLAAVVVRFAKPNSFGELEVQHPGQWLDLLRIS